jgi:hypothetical protein
MKIIDLSNIKILLGLHEIKNSKEFKSYVKATRIY